MKNKDLRSINRKTKRKQGNKKLRLRIKNNTIEVKSKVKLDFKNNKLTDSSLKKIENIKKQVVNQLFFKKKVKENKGLKLKENKEAEQMLKHHLVKQNHLVKPNKLENHLEN